MAQKRKWARLVEGADTNEHLAVELRELALGVASTQRGLAVAKEHHHLGVGEAGIVPAVRDDAAQVVIRLRRALLQHLLPLHRRGAARVVGWVAEQREHDGAQADVGGRGGPHRGEHDRAELLLQLKRRALDGARLKCGQHLLPRLGVGALVELDELSRREVAERVRHVKAHRVDIDLGADDHRHARRVGALGTLARSATLLAALPAVGLVGSEDEDVGAVGPRRLGLHAPHLMQQRQAARSRGDVAVLARIGPHAVRHALVEPAERARNHREGPRSCVSHACKHAHGAARPLQRLGVVRHRRLGREPPTVRRLRQRVERGLRSRVLDAEEGAVVGGPHGGREVEDLAPLARAERVSHLCMGGRSR